MGNISNVKGHSSQTTLCVYTKGGEAKVHCSLEALSKLGLLLLQNNKHTTDKYTGCHI